ncbi:hypothetical protein MBLNU13_g07959t1 [Cladosporium sp. NU13]
MPDNCVDSNIASTSDDTDSDANQAFAPAISVEVNDTPQATGAPTDDLLQGDFTAEAQAHWLDDSLAQLSSFPYLSTRELVDQVLNKKSLRRAMALQIGANVVTHCVPAAANILHREGRQCLCRLPARDTNADIVDWLNQQVGLAVPEYQWHAGATPYARVNYLMVLVEEVFRTLLISWDEAVSQSEDRETVRNALKCIAQAVRSAKLEPQVVLGTWAARNMIPDLHVFQQERLWGSETMDRKSEDNPHALGTSEGDEGTILSPLDSQGARLLRPIARGDVQGTPRPKARRSRAQAPEYDMKRHPVDGTLGDRVVSSRKRKRSQRSEDHQHLAIRKVSPLVIDEFSWACILFRIEDHVPGTWILITVTSDTKMVVLELNSQQQKSLGRIMILMAHAMHSRKRDRKEQADLSSTKRARHATRLSFLDLPRELRDIIYELSLVSTETIDVCQLAIPLRNAKKLGISTALLRVSRLIHHEALEVIYGLNTFEAKILLDPRIPYAYDHDPGLRDS